jgi:hypothetical protein
MDLSFSRMHERNAAGAMPLLSFDLPVLLAASSAWQAGSETARAFAFARRDQQAGQGDWIRALEGLFQAPKGSEVADVSSLQGSFNPLISMHLMVGH